MGEGDRSLAGILPGLTRSSAASAVYLFNPALDLLVVAGGISLLVLPLSLAAPPAAGAFAFTALNILVNYPHYMATNYRVYGSRAQVSRYRFFSVYLTALIVLTAVLSHALVGPWVNVVVAIYLVWTPYHYMGQNYGIALMYARRGGVDVSPRDKWLLYSSSVAALLTYLLLLTMTQSSSGARLLHIELAPEVARASYTGLVTIGVATGAVFVWRLTRRATLAVLAPAVLLMIVQFSWFAVPAGLILFRRQLSITWLDLQLLPLALAFLHCAQYLGVTAYYTKRERTAAAEPFRYVPYFLALIVGGVVLWPVTIRFFSQAFVVDYALSVVVMNALINIHHFILDGAIWKLRDGRIARLLIAPPAAPVAPERPAAAVVSERPAWMRVPPAAVWALLVPLAFVVHGADALRVFMMLKAFGLRQAQKWQDAGQVYRSVLDLNGRVADAMEGLAVAEMQASNVTLAVDHWEKSVRLNPISAHLRAGLGEAYIHLGRVDDAVSQLEEAVRLDADDPTALSLLAQARWAKGDRTQAQALMERAKAVSATIAQRRLQY